MRAARSVARAETRSEARPETRPTSRPAVRPARVAGTTAAAALALAGLTGCAPTIGVEVAPHAADPACAEVMLAVPDELGDDLPKVQTDSQATAAWGEPGGAVTMRCGVEQLGPSADCQHVDSGNGTTVDWIVTTDDAGTWSFVTYGREPAVEVLVPPAVTEDHSTSFIADLAGAVTQVPATKECQ
ncbi:DUF3515 domain-containing protein [Promicromonospora citrea]|uniref:DUF3515 family protein n=1 Tax=Promicromonospora citrea TaxID=43677 RepID=A0A8H9GFF4_9MICO|nr:DUF3515 domain-containing protein [Promicromonospora citrea]GGM15789.1 hypothetical protein GCM10010102_09230 [Promicromonospora citrea]